MYHKTFLTETQAVGPKDGKVKTFAGPNVRALTWGLAENYCNTHGFGYLKVIGTLCEPNINLN